MTLVMFLAGGSQALAGTISGVVYSAQHARVPGAHVTLTGNNVVRSGTTDSSGAFTFGGVSIGTYEIVVQSKTGAGRIRVDVGEADVALTVDLLRTVAVVDATNLPSSRGSGTDLILNGRSIARSPSSHDFSSLLLQVPGAARGANGVVHINGDHGDIDYIVDGVPVPQELNREMGSEFDPQNVSFIAVLQGAYPAQYGERFASVVDINTRTGNRAPALSGYSAVGSYAHVDSAVEYSAPFAGGSIVSSVRAERGDRILDPPNFDSPHDAGSNVNEFLRFTKAHGNHYVNATLVHALQTFQIPNDLARGEPAATDDNETQNDVFAAVQFHRGLNNGGMLSYGVAYKDSRIVDFPDPIDDFSFGIQSNLLAGGSLTDCQRGVVSACAFSLYADRAARDLSLDFEDEVSSEKHDVRYGATFGLTTVRKRYDVTLQPSNFLAPLFDALHPQSAYSVVDDAPNVGHNQWLYLQDTWRLGNLYRLDYGVRADSFQIASPTFADGFAQLSPRLKLTRLFGTRAGAYAYYGRFFTPFSVENVSARAAQLLNLPNQPAIAQFDLRPQRDSDYEIGGHLPFSRGQLGFRVMQKNATDLIDDTQVGVTALHQDINYAQGRIASQSASYDRTLAAGGRFYVSVTRTRSVNKDCETQLLAPCFGAPADWTPADHDQRWDANGGMSIDNDRGGWLSFDAEYGSGLSSAVCASTVVDCKVAPHLVFDVEEAMPLRRRSMLTFTVRNLLNDRYRVTYENAQGNHYAAPRTLEVGVRFGGVR